MQRMDRSIHIAPESSNVSYEALVEQLTTFATSNDASEVQIAMNTMSVTPDGMRFFDTVLEAAMNMGAPVGASASTDGRITTLYWLIQATGGDED